MSRWVRLLIVVVSAAIAFALGVAVGEAIHDNPKPGITITTERTLYP